MISRFSFIKLHMNQHIWRNGLVHRAEPGACVSKGTSGEDDQTVFADSNLVQGLKKPQRRCMSMNARFSPLLLMTDHCSWLLDEPAISSCHHKPVTSLSI